MKDEFIVGGQVLVEAGAHGSTYDLLRRAANSLGEVDGERFVPRGELNELRLSGERPSSRLTLTLPRLQNSGADRSWVAVAVDTYEPKPVEVVFLTVHIGPEGEEIDLEWQIGLTVMPRLVKALSAIRGYMTAWTIDSVGDLFPSDEPTDDGSLPRTINAWNYFGPSLPQETLRALQSLPAAQSVPLGEGWLLRPVESIRDAPPDQFLDALGSSGLKTTSYLAPRFGDRT